MENASKALQIAGGVLLAVMILALVVYAFKQFGVLPQQQSENMTAEQLTKFNKEFEVYNKSQMYGVDVISCLNKVQNYNEKYVLEVGNSSKQIKPDTGKEEMDSLYVGTNKYGNEFQIDIGLRLKTPLSERLVVHRIDENTGKSIEIFSDPGEGKPGHVTDDRKFKDVFNLGDDSKYTFTNYLDTGKDKFNYSVNNMKNNEVSHEKNLAADTKYRLYGDDDERLKNLINFKKDLKLIVKNDGKVTPATDWSDATWYTALYDLKTRQFKCDCVKYNKDTGQINGLYFSEVGLSPTDW